MKLHQKVIGKYRFQESIGKGAWATVYKAIHTPSSIQVAIKAIHASDFNSPKAEFEIIQKIHHQSIIETFDYFTSPPLEFIVLEYFPKGSLRDFLIKNTTMNIPMLKKVLGQLVSAVHFLHSNFICHRDITLSNILADNQMNIKLIDFGLACKFTGVSPQITGFYGSPHYAAPEVLKKISYCSNVDVWSIGVVLFTLAYGYRPFEDPDQTILMQKVISEEPEFPYQVDPSLQDLFSKILVKDPSNRISIQDVLNHPFLSRVELPKEIKPVVNHEYAVIISKKGMKVDNIQQDLLNNVVNDTTVYYKILNWKQPPTQINRDAFALSHHLPSVGDIPRLCHKRSSSVNKTPVQSSRPQVPNMNQRSPRQPSINSNATTSIKRTEKTTRYNSVVPRRNKYIKKET